MSEENGWQQGLPRELGLWWYYGKRHPAGDPCLTLTEVAEVTATHTGLRTLSEGLFGLGWAQNAMGGQWRRVDVPPLPAEEPDADA